MKQTAGSISVEGKHIVKDFRMGTTTTKVFKDISIKVMRGEFVSIMMTHSPEAAKSSSRIITVLEGKGYRLHIKHWHTILLHGSPMQRVPQYIEKLVGR